ncbi:efflux RND transporter permease subunit [bacterium]|nr:efflux RND transporter permease subunit [bacterium]
MSELSNKSTNLGKGGLPGFAIRRPVTMIMLFLSLIVVGIVAWRGIHLELFPEGFNPPFMHVWLAYPNSSPIENQERVGIPTEEYLWTVKGIKTIRTESRETGCSIRLEFNQSVDMDVAYQEVRDRLERVKPELPEDLRYIYIWRYSESEEPITYFSISITGNYEDPYRLINESVVKRLERLDGVAKIEIWGDKTKQIRIEFILERLKACNIDVGVLIRELQSADFTLACGSIDDGEKKLIMRADGRIKNIDELRRLPIGTANLHLEDVADITYSTPRRNWIQRIGRGEAVEITVFKTSDANTVELSENVKNLINEIADDPQMAGLQFDILFDQGEYITSSLDNLKQAGYWGGLFAVIVLFLFLRRLRMTLFITMAIPISLLVTITCLYFMDWSLNIITLSGLMLCVGLVVDNAIVVVESIHTNSQYGMSRKQAAIYGAHEVGLAITLATMTTMVVFLPIMFMSGDRMTSFFLIRIGMPVIIALLASLMTALLFIPLAVNRFAMSGAASEPRIISRASEYIENMVRKLLKNRAHTLLIMLLLLSSIAIPMKQVISTDQENGNINDVYFSFRFPAYYSIDAVDSTMQYYENQIYERSEKYGIKTIVTGLRRGYGRLRIFLQDEKERMWLIAGLRRIARKIGILKTERLTHKEIVEDLKGWLKPPPDVDMRADWRRGSEDESVYVTIYGDDTIKLLDIANSVKRRLEMIPEALTVDLDLESTSDEVWIRFDREKTSRLKVDPLMAATGLISLVRGISLPDVRINGHEIEASAELREEDRETLAQVLNLPVTGEKGRVICLDDVAGVNYGRGLGSITRENRRTRIRIEISTTEDDLEKLSDAISASLSDVALPPGYEWNKGERFQSIEDAARERNQSWMLAVVFVFLILGALFESFLLPWCVIVTVPFSFFGVYWFLFLTGTQFGLMAGIGVIILIGVIVNNAIVLVDRVNRLRIQGMERNEALALASKQRFRPIAMTAMTTIMGLVPMAVGDANLIGIPYAPMGRAIIGGMLAATATTPIIVPLAYSFIDDLSKWVKSYAMSIDIAHRG